MQTKFDEYLEFPCAFTFKIMGVNNDKLEADVLKVIQELVPGEYSPKSRPSSKGNYLALTLSVVVTSKEIIEAIYTQVGALEDVRHIL
ncbi:DUF493 family protein [Alginatibacterium sediminis]|uniref:UPF0250 protein DBZ36_20040 n=1 Tax=Alginatibacterium sediminis TaxID=2164068 RepID=A0A420E5M4_9ALTE|nr:DUF493 family protein YbeD [Alginatibacterium sediminis]RKF12762.1 DUF493 family protein [Alginatibacterium sediminis]